MCQAPSGAQAAQAQPVPAAQPRRQAPLRGQAQHQRPGLGQVRRRALPHPRQLLAAAGERGVKHVHVVVAHQRPEVRAEYPRAARRQLVRQARELCARERLALEQVVQRVQRAALQALALLRCSTSRWHSCTQLNTHLLVYNWPLLS